MRRGLSSEGSYFPKIQTPGGPSLGGDQVIDGATVVDLTADLVCNSLWLRDTAVINTKGYKIYAREFLRISGSASIQHNGENGGDGGTLVGDGLGGLGAPGVSVGHGLTGGDSSDTDGNDGLEEPFFGISENVGGTGGDGAGGTGGTGGASTFLQILAGTPYAPHIAQYGWTLCNATIPATTVPVLGGGGGGAGAGGGGGNKGGGGGGGGGVIWIGTPLLILEDSASIQARGGNGGDGAVSNTGGGGGAGGGSILLYVERVLLKGANSVIQVPGGFGGTGNGTGANCSPGLEGWVYIYSELGVERASSFTGSTSSVLPSGA
jgi:hypothetical protein